MTAIYAIIPAAQRIDINRAFDAMGWGIETFGPPLTSDNPATTTSQATHYHMYNAGSAARDFGNFAAAKAGTALPPHINGGAVAWGENGAITEVEAFAAFSSLQMWANDSTREPLPFALEQMAALGLSRIPMDV